MSKSSQAFRTIREVSDWLDVKAHVLRFWESRFPQIKRVKRAGGRRYYRPGDMELVGGIKVLLHEQGMTIKGVQNLIRDEGAAHVAAMSPPIDMLGFEDAPSDEIEAWDRELAAEAVEDAEVITDKFAADAGLAVAEAEEEGPTAEPEPAAAEPAPLPDAEPQAEAPEPAPPTPIEELPADGDADQSEFDLEAELAQLEAALAIDATAEVATPVSEDAPVDVADGSAPSETAVDDDVPSAFEELTAAQAESDSAQEADAPPAPEEEVVAVAEAAPELAADDVTTAVEPLPEPVAPVDASPAPEETTSPEAAEAEPVAAGEAATPAVAQPEPAPDVAMPALMAEFAELTARIPALPQDQHATLAPILQRSAELAARMSA